MGYFLPISLDYIYCMMKWPLLICIPLVFIFSCKKKQDTTPQPVQEDNFIRGADLSFLPQIEQEGTVFFDKNNIAKNALTILKDNGCNTIRIRLWHTPADIHSSLPEVILLADRVKAAGLKVLLDIHYSDTWADPGHQLKPAAWQLADINTLKDSVYNYTKRVVSIIKPAYVQIGNEINDGFLWEEGRITSMPDFIALLKKGCLAAREATPGIKIMIHYAGINSATWFFEQLRINSVDYDIMGLSYYPNYHGLSLADVQTTITHLIAANNKSLMIAETAYPFTLGYNDYTNNIVGASSQTIPAYPPTPEGQRSFLLALRNIIQQNSKGAGICYWGTEWVAFKGPVATNGSSAENLALFDFNNKELPGMDVFKK